MSAKKKPAPGALHARAEKAFTLSELELVDIEGPLEQAYELAIDLVIGVRNSGDPQNLHDAAEALAMVWCARQNLETIREQHKAKVTP